MTLPALPEMNVATVTTALLCGDTLRDTMVCSAMTSEEPATTGSTLSSGIEPPSRFRVSAERGRDSRGDRDTE